MLKYHASILLAVASIAAGCQQDEPLGHVHGRVTIQGKPLSAGILVFSDKQLGVHMTAELAADGTYELQTAGGFGLPLGTYQVAVCPLPPAAPVLGAPAPAASSPPPAKIPRKYQELDTSGLFLSVGKGDNPFDIDI